jgi:hypothetical protein
MDNCKYEQIKANFSNNLNDLESNLNIYLNQIKNIAGDFGGPSVYFHNRSLQEINIDFLGLTHIEMIYAVLPSWGMHRMGDTSTKIINFDKFLEQIENNREILNELKNKEINEINIEYLSDILVNKLSFSASNSHLVSSSKVLHHIVPNLISPIDKQYSIRFLIQSKNKFLSKTKNGKIKYSVVTYKNEEEFNYSNLFLTGMHDFIKRNKSILNNHLDKEVNLNKNFNSHLTKIFDNLIMIYVKNNGIKEEYGV